MAEVKRTGFRGGRLLAAAAVVAVLGSVACLLGVVVDPTRTLYAWLAALVFNTTIAVGALVLLLIGYAVNGTWMVVLRRLNLAIVSALPALALMFVPVVVGADRLYPWAGDREVADEHLRHLLEHKEPWLNLPAFGVRSAIYFAVFLVLGELFGRWVAARDRGSASAPDRTRERVVASATLPLVALALTFAAFDWTMSLEPAWFSTAYGVYYFAGGFLAAIALLTVLAWATASRARRRDEVARIRGPHFHALGRMMLAFTVFWAYIAFFQLMLIEIADKPEEVPFYLTRSAGSWWWVCWLLILGHFALPVLVLLLRAPKFRGAVMAAVGGWIVLMHVVDVYWLVMPVHDPHGMRLGWIDLAAYMAVTGTALVLGLVRQRGQPLYPLGDPALAASVEYRSPL